MQAYKVQKLFAESSGKLPFGRFLSFLSVQLKDTTNLHGRVILFDKTFYSQVCLKLDNYSDWDHNKSVALDSLIKGGMYMKKGKKLSLWLVLACMMVMLLPMTAFAGSSKVKVKKVEVDQDNDDHDSYKTEIEIDFTSKVTWRSNAKVTSVKDSTGKSYTGILTEKDDDECEVYIKNLKYGRTYTIKISGVKTKGASSYETITVKVKVPAQKKTSKVTVKKVEVDDDDPEVEIKFTSKVTWKSNAKVTSVKDSSGNSYTGILKDTDDDECEVYIKNLKSGRTYTIQISGVKVKGASSYETITVKVKVP